ncbi:MAG: hypothetical protein ABSH06_21815 [Thermodesulfobacteriota bacterium]
MDSQAPDRSDLSPSPATEHIAELQVRKLNLEIKELTRPWWQKPAYLSALFPLFVGILALFVAYNRGFFDTQAALLELKRERLQRDVDTFTAERDRLITNNKDLSQKNADLTAERERLLTDQKLLKDQAASVESQRYALSEELALITLRANIKELSNAIGTNDSTVSGGNLPSPFAIYEPTNNPFYRTILSELTKTDAHQRHRINLVSQEVEAHGTNPPFKAFLLSALAEATKDASWREKLFKLTIDNAFHATGWSDGSPFLNLIMQGPFPTSEKASVLVQLSASVRERKNEPLLGSNQHYQLFLIADQNPVVLDACVPSPLLDAIRVNRDWLLAVIDGEVKQPNEGLQQVQAHLSDLAFDVYWPLIAKLSPQAALVYLAKIAIKTGRNMFVERTITKTTIIMPPGSTAIFVPTTAEKALSPWPASPFPQRTEIHELTSQYWADWLKQNHKIAEVWLDKQLNVISRNPVLLRKVNRRQWIELNEIP